MKNLKPIKKGASWIFDVEYFVDETEAVPVDISAFSFLMTAVYANGSTAFTKTNSDFVADGLYKRTVSLTNSETQALNVGDLYYQIDVTYPDTTSEEWSDGFITVLQ